MTVRNGFIDSVYCGSGVDGKGLRVVVFLCGCNLRCKFCHNPETLYKKGNEVTAEEVYEKCLKAVKVAGSIKVKIRRKDDNE